MTKKKIKCLKCKKEFETDVDSAGIPYKKICSSCKKKTSRYARGVSGRI